VLFRSNREKLTIADVFVLDTSFASLNGDYTFKLQIGELTQTVVVRVGNSTPSINVLVNNVLSNVSVTANATDEFIVNLPATGNARLALDVDFLNMQPASGSTLTYSLTRKYAFDAVKWENTVSNTLTIANKVGSNGHVISSVVDGVPVLSSVLHANSPETTATELVVGKEGTYEYTLTVGTVTKSWKVIVNAFPKVEIVNAYLGSTTVAGTSALSLFTATKQPIIPVQTAGDSNARLWLQVSSVNLAKAVHYYQITSNDAGVRVPNIGGLTSTELDAVTLNFTTATTAFVNVNPVLTDVNPSTSAFTAGAANFATALQVGQFRVWIYNSAKVNIGFVDFKYRVVDPTA
jgi:hypothetical protein